MPRSKRDKQVTLSKVQKKTGMEYKNNQISIIRKEIPKYKRFFAFSTMNTRNSVIKQLRLDWSSDSRFFQTKRSLIRLAFGKTAESEVLKNLSSFGELICQNVGLLMTNKSEKELRSLIDTYNEYDHARSGTKSIATVVIKKGPLNEFVTHSEEPYLRTKLNLPVKLDKGIVHLLHDVKLCNFKQILSAQQALQLKVFKIKLAEFRLNLEAMYDCESHSIVHFDKISKDSRLLDHLTYNTITVEDNDFLYTWNDDDEGVHSEDAPLSMDFGAKG